MRQFKTLSVLLMIVGFSSSVWADQVTDTVTTTSVGKAQSSVYNGNNNGNITFQGSTYPTETTQNVNYSGTQTVKNVPGVNAPPLVSSNDTCMGSSSGGVGVAGFGLSIGSTWADTNCKMLKNSRELWNMGMRGAALARMCMDAENKEALELSGFTCPAKEQKPAPVSSVILETTKSSEDLFGWRYK